MRSHLYCRSSILLLLLFSAFLMNSTCDEFNFNSDYHICLPTAMDCSALGLPDYLVACLDCGPPNRRGVCNQGQFATCSTELPVSCSGQCRPLAKGAKVIGSEGGPEDGDDGNGGGGGGQDDGSYDQENDWSNGNGNAGNGDANSGQWDGN